MPPKPKLTKSRPTKRGAILDAMLAIVVERGLHEASMALVAERAGASTGVIYHHFASKEEILQALYERAATFELLCILDGFSPTTDAREAFLLTWNNLYAFYRRHPRETRFLEQYKSAGFPCRPPVHVSTAQFAAFQRFFSSRAEGGVLNDWPPMVFEELTVGLVARLAKQPQELPATLLGEIGAKIWEAVRAEAAVP